MHGRPIVPYVPKTVEEYYSLVVHVKDTLYRDTSPIGELRTLCQKKN